MNIISVLVLDWNMNLNETHAKISSYQIMINEESSSDFLKNDSWRELGCVRALNLPMTCSLSNVNVFFLITFKYILILIKIVLGW